MYNLSRINGSNRPKNTQKQTFKSSMIKPRGLIITILRSHPAHMKLKNTATYSA